ncbi:MAG: CPBP family intramembrane metalloprotease [Hyphomonadaceae bacterium]|nr:CPBP family intramembrane metalloprotease [Hyphomonadaceae bacterium]
MRAVLISVGKILAFLGLWALFTGLVIMAAVQFSGEGFYAIRTVRLTVEIGLFFAVLMPLVIMALLVDKRGPQTLGFSATRLRDLLLGVLAGGLILLAPIGVLAAIGAARWAPDVEAFSTQALGFGLIACFFNVMTQQMLVRSYIFQELWTKFGAWTATLVTTALFLAMHATALMQGLAGVIAGANILLASLMMSLAYVRTRALWLPIGLHFGWNALQGPVLGINVTGNDLGYGQWRLFSFGGDPLLTGGAMGVEGGLIGLIGPALGLAFVALAIRPAKSG